MCEQTVTGTEEAQYAVLHILDFSSARKRMSVIVRDENNRLFIFCKVWRVEMRDCSLALGWQMKPQVSLHN